MIKHVLVYLTLVCSLPICAAENMYFLVAGGYASTEIKTTDADDASIKLAIGYQIHRQWYLELGFQQLADEEIQTTIPADPADFQPGLQTDAMYAALLGKAASRVGELYYRIGAMRADNKGQLLTQEDSCELGSVTAQLGQYQLCDFDEAVLAGVVGLGFDYFIGNKSMLRTEVEYLEGEQNFRATSVFIGYRYNF